MNFEKVNKKEQILLRILEKPDSEMLTSISEEQTTSLQSRILTRVKQVTN